MLSYPGISLFTGPMKSGKTKELLSVYNQTPPSDKSKTVIGFTTNESSHGGQVNSRTGLTADALCMPSLDPVFISDLCASETIIHVFIDEGQFFPDIAAVATKLVHHGKCVYIAALNGTFECKPWAAISSLLPVCDYTQVMHAICEKCEKPASFTKRLTASTSLIEVGSHYEARCRLCFLKP